MGAFLGAAKSQLLDSTRYQFQAVVVMWFVSFSRIFILSSLFGVLKETFIYFLNIENPLKTFIFPFETRCEDLRGTRAISREATDRIAAKAANGTHGISDRARHRYQSWPREHCPNYKRKLNRLEGNAKFLKMQSNSNQREAWHFKKRYDGKAFSAFWIASSACSVNPKLT